MVDAVVIGSGPNGLVAANVLADHGWSVTVLEAEAEPGGAVRSGELTLPGFVHDRFSSFYPLAVASPAIKALDLEQHGLRWRRHPLPVAHPASDGSVAYVSPDLDETAACLDGFAAGNALHGDFAPEHPGSAMFGWVLCGLAQTVGFPIPEGGSSALTDALVRRLESRGGTVQCEARVTAVEVRRNRATAVRTAAGDTVGARRAILADVGAPQLYTQLLAEEHVPGPVLRAIERFHYGNSTFKVDFALDGPIPWLNADTGRAGTVHVTEGLDALTRASTDIVLRLLPENPFLVAGQYAVADPTRMPEGREIFWAYTHIPQTIEGDASDEGLNGDWTDESQRERFADRIEAQVERVAPGFRNRILARHITTPGELERMDANLVGGALNGGTAQLHQELVFRPIPGTGRAETPITGLYLASASAYPSGGVHGACGANAARSALREHGVLRRGAAKLTAALSGQPR